MASALSDPPYLLGPPPADLERKVYVVGLRGKGYIVRFSSAKQVQVRTRTTRLNQSIKLFRFAAGSDRHGIGLEPSFHVERVFLRRGLI